MTTPLIEKAQEIINRDAADFVTELADTLVTDGKAEWIEDPWVDGVAALVVTGTKTALLVVYVERDDWEMSDDFEDMTE